VRESVREGSVTYYASFDITRREHKIDLFSATHLCYPLFSRTDCLPSFAIAQRVVDLMSQQRAMKAEKNEIK
jgi:hypothetical protein